MSAKDLSIGDLVQVINADIHRCGSIGLVGVVVENPNPSNGCVRVSAGDYSADFKPEWLKKIEDKDNPNKIVFSAPVSVVFENDSPVEKFRKMCEEIVQTYETKNATYGDAYSDGFKRFGATQLVSRIYEKYCRVENLLCHKAENKVPDETVKDTLTDMAVQCLVLRMLIEDNDMEQVE